jgi:hypothetical protein
MDMDGNEVVLSREDLVKAIGDAEIIILKCIPRNDSGDIVAPQYDVKLSLKHDKDMFNLLTSHMQMSLHLD